MRKDHNSGGILFIRLKSIGDILFTLPAIHQVRQTCPDTRISFLVSKEHAPLLRGFSSVDEVRPLNRAALRSANPVRILGHLAELLSALRKSKFELTVDFQGYGETALLTRWTSAPRRVGVVAGGRRRWAYTHPVERQNHIHPAEFNLSLVRACGLPVTPLVNKFHLPAEPMDQARGLLLQAAIKTNAPLLCIQPFTSNREKNWPIDAYVQVASWWRMQGCGPFFICGAAESAALDPVRHAGFAVFAGAPLLIAAGLMKSADVVLGGDTGLLHLAVAMAQRVVMLMKYTAPGNSYPFGHKDWAIAPVPGHSLATVSPERVKTACQIALKDRLACARPESQEELHRAERFGPMNAYRA